MAKKTAFAFKPMPSQAKGTPQRPAMPPGQAKSPGSNHGLAKPHKADWHTPHPNALKKVKGSQ